MAFILWVIRLLVGLMVVRLVLRVFMGTPTRRRPVPPAPPRERIGGTLVRDPQCGTYVPQTKAVAFGRGAGTLFFCSTSCRDAWTAAHRS